jgi:cytochrome P450
MRVILKTMFSAEAEGELVDLAAGVTAFVEATHRGVLPIIYRSVQHWPLPPVRRLEAARHRLDTIMFRIIEQRRAATERPADFLTMLVEEQEGDGNDAGMSAEQVRDEAITIFATGHETTATALTWTWYLLSQHPGAEANLHGELATVLGGRAPTFADMPQLRLTEAIVSEALRLYPPVWVMARKTTEPYTLAGHTVPPNSYLHMSQYLVHRDARWFPDPERFDPARWTSEATTATRPKYSYFPFGGGPRQCIGEGLAWMELILTIATLAQQWRLRLVPGHRVEMAPLVTLRPRGGMPMLLERRETC